MTAPYMTGLRLPNLSNTALVELLVQWEAGVAALLAGPLPIESADDFEATDVLARFHGLRALRCSRRVPDCMISAIDGPHGGSGTWHLTIRMQSGDVIEIEFQTLEVRRAFPGQQHVSEPDLDAKFEDLLCKSIRALVTEDYDHVSWSPGRATPDGIRSAVLEYPATLVDPPPEAFAEMSVFAVRGETGAWRVEMPLWTREEGRSDLWILMDVRRVGDQLIGAVDDIRVL